MIFRAYTDGLYCSEFGQGSIPVIGYSPEGNSLALTSRGELEIELDPLLQVGCVGCLQVIDAGTMTAVVTFTTPAWSLHLVGIGRDGFVVTNRGEALVRAKSRCIRLATDERFALVHSDRCRPDMQPVSRDRAAELGFNLRHNQLLFESRNTQHFAVVASATCH